MNSYLLEDIRGLKIIVYSKKNIDHCHLKNASNLSILSFKHISISS